MGVLENEEGIAMPVHQGRSSVIRASLSSAYLLTAYNVVSCDPNKATKVLSRAVELHERANLFLPKGHRIIQSSTE